MPNQRADIVLTSQEIAEFLAGAHTCVLVTIGPDGFPDPVGMWYVPGSDGSIWMRTYAKSQKVLNLQRDPRAAVLVESGARYSELKGVQLTGSIELVDDEDTICDVFADLMIRYEGMDPQYRDAAREGYRLKAPKQRALHLVPERIVSWDHSKQVSTPTAQDG